MNEDLKKAKEEVETEATVVKVIKGEIAELSLRSVAKVKARLRAYEAVYDNYQNFITKMATELAADKLKDNTYKEMGVARLVAAWIIETETFLDENEDRLHGIERETRNKFVGESLKDFPDDIREMLLDKLKEKKLELLEWFSKELQLAQKTVTERRLKEDVTAK